MPLSTLQKQHFDHLAKKKSVFSTPLIDNLDRLSRFAKQNNLFAKARSCRVPGSRLQAPLWILIWSMRTSNKIEYVRGSDSRSRARRAPGSFSPKSSSAWTSKDEIAVQHLYKRLRNAPKPTDAQTSRHLRVHCA
jgi:hypothetical protein